MMLSILSEEHADGSYSLTNLRGWKLGWWLVVVWQGSKFDYIILPCKSLTTSVKNVCVGPS